MTAIAPSALQSGDVRQPQAAPLLVDIAVLTEDLALFETVRRALGERNPVWRARSAEESVDLLLSGRCGVLLIDMASVAAPHATLIEQILSQFPDIVIVAAGRRDDEAALSPMISDGRVFRFMHMPVSSQRVEMFLDAAMRRHVERRGDDTPVLQSLASRLPTDLDWRKWSFVGAGVLLFVGALTLALRRDAGEAPATVVDAVAPSLPATIPAARADPVLSRARAALASGRYEAPTGNNALDLYQAVLLSRPDDPEARAGLERSIAAVLAQAELNRGAGRIDEARRLLARARSAAPQSPGVLAMQRRLQPAAAAPSSVAQSSAAPPTVARSHARAPAPAALPAPPATASAILPAPTTGAPAQPERGQPPRAASPQRSYGAPIISGHATATLDDGGFSSAPAAPLAALKVPIDASIGNSAITDAGIDAGNGNAAGTAARREPARAVRQRISTVEPEYPRQARASGAEGWVRLEYSVSNAGTVTDIAVLEAKPRGTFDAAAIRALRQWRYAPLAVDVAASPERKSVVLTFELD